MARVPDLIEFCREHNMKMLTVAELIRYRMAHERYVNRVGEALIDTRFGEFRLIAYSSEVDGGESHVALVRGDIEHSQNPVLVRMHAHCLMGDVFGATGCECHATLEGSTAPHRAGGPRSTDLPPPNLAGILHRKSRGPHRAQLPRRTDLPSLYDNTKHIQREIGIGAQILSDLNLRRVRLLTNRPKKVAALEGFGIEIVEQVPVQLNEVKAGKKIAVPTEGP